MVDGEVVGGSFWIMQNIQKFSKVMDISLEDMEDIPIFFFSEIEKKKNIEEKERGFLY